METARHCTIYRGCGQVEDASAELPPVDAAVERDSIRTIMARDLVCVGPDAAIATVVRLMIGGRLGCIPVVDRRRHPIGVVTKLDLVEQLDAALRTSARGYPLPSDLVAHIAEDLMMPIALSLEDNATVVHAAAMMVSEDTHHVLVVSPGGALVGVVSAKDIARWVAERAGEVAPLGESTH